jgi:hypothetical protein
MTTTGVATAARKRPAPWTIYDFVKLLAVGFLLIPAAQSLGPEDYAFIRWLVTIITACGAARAFYRKNHVWGTLFLVPTVLFNPFLQLRLVREAWILVDLGTAVLLAISLTQPL